MCLAYIALACVHLCTTAALFPAQNDNDDQKYIVLAAECRGEGRT